MYSKNSNNPGCSSNRDFYLYTDFNHQAVVFLMRFSQALSTFSGYPFFLFKLSLNNICVFVIDIYL